MKLSDIQKASTVLSEMDAVNKMPTDTEFDAILLASSALPVLLEVISSLRQHDGLRWLVKVKMKEAGIEVDT